MLKSKRMAVLIWGMVLALILGTGALAGCGSSSGGSSASSSDSSTKAASTAAEDDADVPAVATKEDIDKYCGVCHFQNVDNDAISSFNKDNIDAAMVESMCPDLSEARVDSIVAYFSTIEPQQQMQQ